MATLGEHRKEISMHSDAGQRSWGWEHRFADNIFEMVSLRTTFSTSLPWLPYALFWKGTETMGTVGCISTMIQTIPLVGAMIPTEITLKEKLWWKREKEINEGISITRRKTTKSLYFLIKDPWKLFRELNLLSHRWESCLQKVWNTF